MYKVCYYLEGTKVVSLREFETLKESTDFALSLPINSVLEIKYYDNVDRRKENRN
jgi:hypothetical protein